jgi:hypothetical protein
MTRRRELTFEDCASTIEAELKLRAWLQQIAEDRARETATTTMVRTDDGIDPDLLDASDAAIEADIALACQLLRLFASGGKAN